MTEAVDLTHRAAPSCDRILPLPRQPPSGSEHSLPVTFNTSLLPATRLPTPMKITAISTVATETRSVTSMTIRPRPLSIGQPVLRAPKPGVAVVQMSSRMTVASPIPVSCGLLTAAESATTNSVLLPRPLSRISLRSPPLAGNHGSSPVQILVSEQSGTMCKPMIASLMPLTTLPTESPKLTVLTSSSADGLKALPLELKSGEKWFFLFML